MTLTCKIVKTSGGTKKISLMLSRYLKKQSVKYKSRDQKKTQLLLYGTSR